ncbi:MAG: transcriptional repressor [Gammaproteobacteria bacterium]|nr:transcriptional repressor [Gammaproteobacteria bacterium]
MLDSTKNPILLRDEICELLRSRGVTPTSQRIEIGSVLLAQPQHLSAEQILAEVRRHGLRVSKATIYNTLNLFVRQGLVREVNVDPTRTFYDSTTHPHHHFFNADTGELIDIPPNSVVFEQMPVLPEGTVQDRVDVVIRLRNES